MHNFESIEAENSKFHLLFCIFIMIRILHYVLMPFEMLVFVYSLMIYKLIYVKNCFSFFALI